MLAAPGGRGGRGWWSPTSAGPTSPSIARENVERFFGGPHPAWRLRVGDLAGIAAATSPGATSPDGPGGADGGDPGPSVEHEEAEADGQPFDRVVLDMVAPWEHIGTAAGVLIGGGVICCYVSTVTQLSRAVEAIREQGSFDEPAAWESLTRGWHVDGLAVRPGAPDDRPHRLPGDGAAARRGDDPAAPAAQAGQGRPGAEAGS